MNIRLILIVCTVSTCLFLVPAIYGAVNLRKGCPIAIGQECILISNDTYEVWEIYNTSESNSKNSESKRRCGTSKSCPNPELCEEEECENKVMTSLLIAFFILTTLSISISLVILAKWWERRQARKRHVGDENTADRPC